MGVRKPTKRWTVKTWFHRKSGEMLSVFYDKGSSVFWGQVGSRQVEAKTQGEAVKLVDAIADELLDGDTAWERMLVVAVRCAGSLGWGNINNKDVYGSPQPGFWMKRLWVRKYGNGGRYTRQWVRFDEEPPGSQWRDHEKWEEQQKNKDMQMLREYVIQRDEVMVPYSDELWNRLLELGMRLEELNGAIKGLIASEDFEERILRGLPALLTVGEGAGG